MKHIKIIGQMIQNGIIHKEYFLPILEEADKEILQFSINMDYKEQEHPNLFYQTTDERLNSILEKQNKIHLKPEVTIQECVKSKLSIIDNFFKKYHIGFVRSAQIKESGYVEVDVPCSIHSSFVSDDRESAKATFNAQIEFLKEIGLEIIDTKHFGKRILKTKNNIDILEKLLKSRGCNQIKFRTVDDFIDGIKFIFNIIYVNNFKEEPINIFFETNNKTLNNDEIGKITKYVKEILYAKESIGCLGDKIKNTCCSLVEGYFDDICKIFNYEGEITKRIKERYETERNKNIEIQNIERNICDSIPVEKFKEVLESYKKKIDDFTKKNLSHHVSDFYIDKYGFVCCQLYFICIDWLDNSQLPSEEYLKENFKMSSGKQEDESLAILDTYENKLKIAQILKEFCPTSRITNIECGMRNGDFCIDKIHIIIDDISNIL